MVGLVQIGDLLVTPVDRQRVLDQVVRADGEEVHPLGQKIGAQGGARHLDHRADLHLFVVGNAPFVQLPPGFIQHLEHGVQLAYPADHREHDPQLAKGRSPEQRP